MLHLFGNSFLVKTMRRFASYINSFADFIEAKNKLTLEQTKILGRNIKFKDKHKNQAGYVIVNGPSLAAQNIDKLKNKVTFVVAGFWKHDAVLSWQPTYYSILDANFFKQTPEIDNFYKSLRERIRSSIFFFPLFRGFDMINKNKYFKPDEVYYIASLGDVDHRNELTDIVQGFAGVGAFALSQAIYMGCNPIYLLGFDHDYLANRGLDRHFYQGSTIKGGGDITLAERTPYDEEMKANTHLWANYRRLDRIAKERGIKIFNATNGGYLDVFERVSFNDLT